MKKIIFVLILVMLGSIYPVYAQKEITIEKPKMKIFIPDDNIATGRTVIVLPGGGYAYLASRHEGVDWKEYFCKQGITMAVLFYTLPKGNGELPLEDVRSAMEFLRKHAKEWNINPDDIGVMGSSAGGHLASAYSTHAPKGFEPSFQILLYPVISMDPKITHAGSRDNFLGEDPSQKLVDLYSNEKQVDEKTPRALIFAADDDNVVPIENTIRYYSALKKNKIPSSVHIFPSGGHGFGFGKGYKYRNEMLASMSSWLKSF